MCSQRSNLVPSGMPSFISQTPLFSSMTTEGNVSQASGYGVLDQSLGYRFGDPATINQTVVSNLTLNSQKAGLDLMPNPFNKAAASTNTIFTLGFAGSQAVQSQNVPQSNPITRPSAQRENWGESNMEESSSHTDDGDDSNDDIDPDDKNQKLMGESGGVGVLGSSDKPKRKPLDQKTMRRLAQNREAARKSRLRKKAYVQQLESSRIKLSQLEQELQRARQQGTVMSNNVGQSHAVPVNGTLTFDMEYRRWMEDQSKQINELRKAFDSHVDDNELRTLVENVKTHYNEIFRLKSNAAKVDIFHVLSGMWKTPTERCFMWMGGFRPSELLKLLVSRLEPLTEQQLSAIYNLQESSQQAEDALSQGMDALQQSLAETLAGSSGPERPVGNVANYMGQMAMSMGKLGSLEGFLIQSDNLRQQTLQHMHRVLTTRQSGRALLLIHDYSARLRALSSLWLARPQE